MIQTLLNPAMTQLVMRDVRDERAAQDSKWGEQNVSPERWLAILAEEFGEASKEVVEIGFLEGWQEATCRKRVRALGVELVQVAAVAVAFGEYLRRVHPDALDAET